MTKLLISAVALVAGTSAFAGSPVYVAPDVLPVATVPTTVAPIADWSGLYAGVQAGMLKGDISTDTAEGEIDGTIYGAHIGYNYDFGRFVLGGELDYNIGSGEGVSGGTTTDLDYSIAHLKARAGYDLGSVLAYATTGVAWFEYDEPAGAQDGTGYFVGLGAEYRISNDWSVGAEYLAYQFTEFGDASIDGDVDLQTLMARVSYHF